ncbi:non-ribosomal peptide synthetase [Nocardia amamiensis]|uniref:non-ribosomal peptide synthetase n=1 Tax=Nocardia amamiensis TaxID=404578 RepID=UPI0008305151|nr:non-ribosomal peptide synthetase [Nocardia amamiensis]
MTDQRHAMTELDPDEKRLLLERLLRARAERELSPGERGLWLHSKLAPQSASYNLLYVGRRQGTLDIARLEVALANLVRRHELLGTTFRMSGDRPVAVPDPDSRIPVHTLDATNWSQQRVDGWLDSKLGEPIDLEKGPVLQVTVIQRASAEYLLTLAMPHIAVDFWSLDLVLSELSALYRDPAVELPELPARYADYVRWQSQLLNSERGEKLWSYWKQQLAGDLPHLELPSRRPRSANQTFVGATHAFDIGQPQTRELRELARTHGVTLQVAVLSAFFAVLQRYSRLDDIIIGSPIAGREMPGSEGIVGYFVNSVALRCDLSDNPTYATLLERVRRTVLDAIEHQEFPFALVAERLVPVRDPAYAPVFQVFFAWETSRTTLAASAGSEQGGQIVESLSLRQGGAPVDLMLMVAERENTLSAVLQYNSDLFDTAMIGRLADHLREFLAMAAVNPDELIGRLPLLTRDEVSERAGWNDTAVPGFQGRRLHDLVLEQVRRTPEAVAVSYRDHDISYRELHRRAAEVAARLYAAGARPGDAVGIALERSEMSVICPLGALLAGCAFLPVDPRHPAERLRAISEESSPAVWITDSRLRHRLPKDVPVVCVDIPTPDAVPGFVSETDMITPDSIAYIMFTSGTTGLPKGARNTHRGISNRLLWMQQAYPLTDRDVVLHKTPANFDVSVWELFWALLVGARIVVAEPERHRDSGYLVQTIIEHQVTVAHFVPSMLRAFLADPGAERCVSLREVITSGEALTADLRDRFFATVPARLHNLYGPTEAAIDVTFYDCVRGDTDPIIPIGRPIANTHIHVVDRFLNPVPVGVVGEIYIGGIGVAQGYLNRPELTAERFVEGLPGPGGKSGLAYPNGLMYRTGDLARYRPDGNIEYLGRADNQVKIRGVRIELGEIESALAEIPQVREAAVVVRGERTETPRLVAYVVAAESSASPSAGDLRGFLRHTLPDAMIPAQFVMLERIPTTPTGKRDDRALPDPEASRPDISSGYRPPRTGTERTLAGLWQEVLGIDTVGVFDDFFELGGASTQVMQICTGARDLGIVLTPELVFRHRTVAGLAASAESTDAPTTVEPVTASERFDTILEKSPDPDRQPSAAVGNTIIESIGVYLPDTVVHTAEVLAGCDQPIEIPLEQLTGIKTRRVVGPGEFTIDLARRAAEQCLAGSAHTAATIDLLICTNISNTEGPDRRLISEPSISMRLRRMLGLHNALSFDVSNACAGMFTGIAVADQFLATGRVRTAMVVSGEYVSHIIGTAQQEITDFLDDRLACLTVGDAGAAVILERGTTNGVGFHDLRLHTLSRYSDLCIGKRTDQPHGGAIMRTKAVEQTAVAVRKSVPFAMQMLEHNGWQPEAVDRILMHQTSQASINDAMTTINRLIGRTAAHPGNTVSNLEHRGNTASTTHFVAINDLVQQGEVQAGDRILFSVTGSGQTIGAALYTFDDLPDRMRTGSRSGRPSAQGTGPARSVGSPSVRIESVALASPVGEDRAVDLATRAARQCLGESGTAADDLGLVLYAGVFRDEYTVEPATATFVADRLKINDDPSDPFTRATLAFDLCDGGTGFLKACYVAATAIDAGKTSAALVVAAEADPDVPSMSVARRGIGHMGSAAVLAASEGDGTGFGAFHFACYPEHLYALTAFTRIHGDTGLEFEQHSGIEDIYLKLIHESLEEILNTTETGLSDIGVVLAPQISSDFLDVLADRIDIPRDRIVDVAGDGPDLYTSSVSAAMRYCHDNAVVRRGDIGIIIAVGAGIQVGCALYHF